MFEWGLYVFDGEGCSRAAAGSLLLGSRRPPGTTFGFMFDGFHIWRVVHLAPHSRPEELVFLHVVLKRNVSNDDFVPVTGDIHHGPLNI